MSSQLSRMFSIDRSTVLLGSAVGVVLAALAFGASQAALRLTLREGDPISADRTVATAVGLAYLLLIFWLTRRGRVSFPSAVLIAVMPALVAAAWERVGMVGADGSLVVSFQGPELAAAGALLGFVLGWFVRERQLRT